MTQLAGKKTLITGAGSGIGKALALLAAQKGARLILTDVNRATLDAVAAEVRQRGGQVLLARAFDIADYEAVRAFAEEVSREHGSADVLVNNAGIAIWGRVESMAHADWRKVNRRQAAITAPAPGARNRRRAGCGSADIHGRCLSCGAAGRYEHR